MSNVEDPFATAEDIPSTFSDRQAIIRGGRYRLPNLDGSHKPYGWARVTNVIGSTSDTKALADWEMFQVMQAVRTSASFAADMMALPDLSALSRDKRVKIVAAMVDRAKTISGGNIGRERGNKTHAAVEAKHAGVRLGARYKSVNERLQRYTEALEIHKLDPMPGMQERRILVEEIEAVGTLDNILTNRVTSENHIGDLKSQRRFWTFMEIAAQLAAYAHAVAMWQPTESGGRWVSMPKVSLTTGIIMWMPKIDEENPTGDVTVMDLDIDHGWRTAKRAYEVYRDRSAGKSKRNPICLPRPVSTADLIEGYARLFATVETPADGTRLVEECRRVGAWNPITADAARSAKLRLESR